MPRGGKKNNTSVVTQSGIEDDELLDAISTPDTQTSIPDASTPPGNSLINAASSSNNPYGINLDMSGFGLNLDMSNMSDPLKASAPVKQTSEVAAPKTAAEWEAYYKDSMTPKVTEPTSNYSAFAEWVGSDKTSALGQAANPVQGFEPAKDNPNTVFIDESKVFNYTATNPEFKEKLAEGILQDKIKFPVIINGESYYPDDPNDWEPEEGFSSGELMGYDTEEYDPNTVTPFEDGLADILGIDETEYTKKIEDETKQDTNIRDIRGGGNVLRQMAQVEALTPGQTNFYEDDIETLAQQYGETKDKEAYLEALESGRDEAKEIADADRAAAEEAYNESIERGEDQTKAAALYAASLLSAGIPPLAITLALSGYAQSQGFDIEDQLKATPLYWGTVGIYDLVKDPKGTLDKVGKAVEEGWEDVTDWIGL